MNWLDNLLEWLDGWQRKQPITNKDVRGITVLYSCPHCGASGGVEEFQFKHSADWMLKLAEDYHRRESPQCPYRLKGINLVFRRYPSDELKPVEMLE